MDRSTIRTIASEYKGNTEVQVLYFSEESKPVAIPGSCFEDSRNIREFHCPNSVLKIGNNAFYGCFKLTKFILNKDSLLEEIGKSAFKGCSIRDFAIPANLDAGKCDFTGIISIGENYNSRYIFESTLLMDIDKKMIFGIFAENEKSYIPNTVEFIQVNPFHPSSCTGKVDFEAGNPIFFISFGRTL